MMMVVMAGFFDVSPVLDLPSTSNRQLAFSLSNNKKGGNDISEIVAKAAHHNKMNKKIQGVSKIECDDGNAADNVVLVA